jgi:hypothetical protein
MKNSTNNMSALNNPIINNEKDWNLDAVRFGNENIRISYISATHPNGVGITAMVRTKEGNITNKNVRIDLNADDTKALYEALHTIYSAK